MELVFVLVGTRHPANLGAAARALKTMGFSALRLVQPCAFRFPPDPATGDRGPAYQLGMYSHDILDGAGVFDTLAGSVADCDLAVGTTAKLRHHRHSVLTPAQLKEHLLDKRGMLGRVALVFGPEDTGLTNAHLQACTLLTTVPLAAPQPSINLAQAVMVYAYALSGLPAPGRSVPDTTGPDTTGPNTTGPDTTGPNTTGPGTTTASYTAAIGEVLHAAEQLGVDADARIAAWLRERVPLLPARDLKMLFNLLRVREKRGG